MTRAETLNIESQQSGGTGAGRLYRLSGATAPARRWYSGHFPQSSTRSTMSYSPPRCSGRAKTARSFAFQFAAVVAAFLLLAVHGRADNYTIESSDSDEIDFAVTGNVQPGDTIYLHAQTRAKLTLMNIQGTAANPITITNSDGQFIYDATSASGGDTWRMLGCKHVIIKGTPSAGSYAYGIKIAATKSGQYGMFFGQTDAGVGSSDFEVQDIEIGHTGYAGLGAQCSLTASSGFVMANVKIHGLYIHDTGGEGMYIGSSYFATTDAHEIHGAEIYNNIVENTGWDGIQLGCATENASIHDNIISGYGISAPDTIQDEGIRSNPGTAADIYNNIVIGSPTNSGTGILANPYNSVKIYNNVIVTPEESGIYVLETSQSKGYVADYTVLVMNNTIVAPAEYGILFGNPAHSANDRILNNFIVAAPTGQEVSIFPSLLAESSVTKLAASVAAAGFVNAAENDYRLLSSSPAVDAGVDVSSYGVTTDIDGVPRPQGFGYDAGAFEFVPPLTITTQPSGRVVNAGANVTFSVSAIGPGTITYQWRKDGTPISGATGSSLSLTNVQAGDAADYTVVVSNFNESVTSNAATLTLTTLPTIDTQPASQAVAYGATVTFTVVANGPGTLSYQWKKSGSSISGATGASFVLSNVQAGDDGDYTVVITNANGSTTSDAATLNVIPPPAITAQPMVRTVNLGVNATLSVTASGTGPFTYQWLKDGTPISGATAATLTLANTQSATAGSYTVVVTGPGGATTSSAAALTVNNTVVTAMVAIAGYGQAGSAYCPATGTFDEQPTWDNTGQTPSGTAASPYVSTETGYANRTWYIDFGANYANVAITGTWTRYMPSTTASYSGFGTMWWDDDTDDVNDNGVTATGLNFGTAQSLNTGSNQPWVRDVDAASAPITPQRRYLIINTGSAPAGRANEFAITGNVAPPDITTQPASQTVGLGANVTFTVAASGGGSLSYQWKKNNVDISGATSASLVLNNVQSGNAGAYTVVVSSAGGAIASNTATLVVNDTSTILAIAGYGQAGSSYCPATGAFNEQPTWDGADHVPVGVSASPYTATETGYASRTWYIDFGANYANVRIIGTWTRYMPYTTGSYSGFGTMWWDDDTDSTNDDGVTETGLNFGTAQSINTGSNQPWEQDTNHDGAPITPQRRYLIISTGSAPTTRANEFAVSGYTVQ